MALLRRHRKRKPAPPNVETIRAVAAAFDARDADEYVSHMTEDVVVRPPGFILGQREMRGHEQVKAAFAEGTAALGTGRTLVVSDRRYFLDRADETRVVVVNELTISSENGGELETYGTQSALLFTMTGDSKVSRLEAWPTMAEGLAQLEDPVAIDA
jgi:ketosteroid isomerase-like protein